LICFQNILKLRSIVFNFCPCAPKTTHVFIYTLLYCFCLLCQRPDWFIAYSLPPFEKINCLFAYHNFSSINMVAWYGSGNLL
jgi:hypothetical protein